ncbi:hypothetical protein GK091_24345 [Spirosoma agri]|uniref:Uncharacterized protein n=1 Tax=Spirosoma agri TaxID=1987381 RepID=A0A6M0ISK7_9BACT|nr:hypothetical protein [Spirosoma agri]NEU70033.1 hypothetical protein [Spirosoma agri]
MKKYLLLCTLLLTGTASNLLRRLMLDLFLSVAALLLFTQMGTAQTLDYVTGAGGGRIGNDQGRATVTDASSNVCVTGMFSSAPYYGCTLLVSAGGNDMWPSTTQRGCSSGSGAPEEVVVTLATGYYSCK